MMVYTLHALWLATKRLVQLQANAATHTYKQASTQTNNEQLSPLMRRAAPWLRVLHPDGWSAGLGLAGNDLIK
jgi:hypothetical protein